MEGKPVTILVTGIGSPGAFGVVRSLRQIRERRLQIIGADANSDATGQSWVDGFHVVPRADSGDFPQVLTDVCKAESVDVVLPLVTRELVPLAEMQEDLAVIGTRMPLPTVETLRKANHKGMLFRTLAQANIPVPQFQSVKTLDELRSSFMSMGYPARPVCFKPVYGDGRRGFRILDKTLNAGKSLFEDKPDSTHISETELFDKLQNNTGIPELVVMEYLPGAEYSVDLLARHGEMIVSVVRLREQITGGITTKGRIVDEPDVVRYVTSVVSALGLHGNVGVQVRRNDNGEPRILEVNPRLQGTTILCTAAGVNLPWLGVKLALGEEIQKTELEFETGVRLVRHWDEVFFRSDGSAFTMQ